MRNLKLTTFAILGMTSIISLAQAQSMNTRPDMRMGYDGGMRASTPHSTRASNIVPSNTRSTIAPALPPSAAGDDAATHEYLRAAHNALVAGRTGEAQQSLEMAETRELTRVVPPEAAGVPDPNTSVSRIHDALLELGEGHRGRAIEIIDTLAAN